MNQTNFKSLLRHMVYAAVCLALCMVLPFLTGQIPQIGSMLCPMHIPALLCGFVCGWPWGLAVGFVSPLLRMALFGMPPVWVAIAMAFEMGVYGAVAGILYRVLPKNKGSIYVSLLGAMVAGRLAWGLVKIILAGVQKTTFPLSAFFAGAITGAIPGIILQLILIPVVVMLLEKAGYIPGQSKQ